MESLVSWLGGRQSFWELVHGPGLYTDRDGAIFPLGCDWYVV